MSQQMPTAQESELLAETWAEVLDGEIPVESLDAAYVRAMRDKTDSFPLTANDMVKAHRDNRESARVPASPPQDSNLLTGDVCPRCHGTGLEQYREGGYINSRRCDHVTDDEEDVSMF